MENSNQISNHYVPPSYNQHPSAPAPQSDYQPAQNPDYIPFNSNKDPTYEPINEQLAKKENQFIPDQSGAPPPYPVQAGYPGQVGGVAYYPGANSTTIYVQQVIVPLADPPPTYMVQSILNLIFCCWVFGIVAVTKSVASDAAAKTGRREDAVRESREARKWNIVGLIVGSLVWTGLIITIVLLIVLDD